MPEWAKGEKMDKNTPKALIKYRGNDEGNYGKVHCPNCKALLPVGKGKFIKCPYCLQGLDWDLPKR